MMMKINRSLNKESIKKIFFSALFVFLSSVSIAFAAFFVQPIWRDWNNYNTITGFYKEPKDSIEILFLGASTVVNGIIPTMLYSDYGVSAYNLGTEQQPMMASYYWMKEACRLNPNSLRTVIVDIKELCNTPDDAFIHKAIDRMHFSSVKWEAAKDLSDNLNERVSFLIPLFSYHNRWTDLEKEDFEKVMYVADKNSRGYHLDTVKYIDYESASNMWVPNYVYDPSSEEQAFDKKSLYYLQKMIIFCKNQNLRLILIKTPDLSGWTDMEHKAMLHLSDLYGLEYYDFNYAPLLDEIGFNAAVDSTDSRHMNYNGARKFTDWFGKFLVSKCAAHDYRNDQSFLFLKNESDEYMKLINRQMSLVSSTDPAEYLQLAVKNPDNTIFIAIKDDASASLTKAQRSAFNVLGLKNLSVVGSRDSYIGIIQKGEVVYDCTDSPGNHPEVVSEYDHITQANNILNDDMLPSSTEEEPLYLKAEGILADGTSFCVMSGGFYMGNIASCLLNNVECGCNNRGLNIVIYDSKEKRIVDSTSFDTWESDEREQYDLENELKSSLLLDERAESVSPLQKELLLYNKKCELCRLVKETKINSDPDDFIFYLNTYINRNNTTIFLSVMDDGSYSMSDYARKVLKSLGLNKLSQLEFRGSYIGIITDGEVLLEKTGTGPVAVKNEMKGFYCLESGGCDSGNDSVIQIGDDDYSCHKRGINVAIYDTDIRHVIDTAVFDTFAYPMTVPEALREMKE